MSKLIITKRDGSEETRIVERFSYKEITSDKSIKCVYVEDIDD